MNDEIVMKILTYLVKKHNKCCAITRTGLICSKKRKIIGYCFQHYTIIKDIIFKSYELHVLSGCKALK